jgi:hypothetical protein
MRVFFEKEDGAVEEIEAFALNKLGELEARKVAEEFLSLSLPCDEKYQYIAIFDKLGRTEIRYFTTNCSVDDDPHFFHYGKLQKVVKGIGLFILNFDFRGLSPENIRVILKLQIEDMWIDSAEKAVSEIRHISHFRTRLPDS